MIDREIVNPLNSPPLTSSWRWAVVVSTDPLQVRPETQTDPLAAEPSTLVRDLNVGDRVWCQLYGKRVIIHGVGGGGGGVIALRRGGVPGSVPDASVTVTDPGPTEYLYGDIEATLDGGVQVNVPGWYDVKAMWRWDSRAGSARQIRININGAASSIETIQSAQSGNNLTSNTEWSGPLEAGDEIHMALYQNTGSSLSGTVFAGGPALIVARVGPMVEQIS